MKYTNLKKGDILIHKNNNRKITLENRGRDGIRERGWWTKSSSFFFTSTLESYYILQSQSTELNYEIY